MKNRIREKTAFNFALCLLLLNVGRIYGGFEKYSSAASTSIGAVTPLTTNVLLITQDTKYIQYLIGGSVAWGGAITTPSATGMFYDKDIRNRIFFSIDHPGSYYTTTAYSVQINFQITYKRWTGSSFTPFVINDQLTITNNQTAINRDKAVYEFANGGNELQVQVTGITITGSGITLTNAKLLLESEIEIERYYYFDQTVQYPSADLIHCSADLITKGELEIEWQNKEGAEEYELEWVYVNNYDGTKTGPTFGNIAPASILLDEKLFELNSTRITTSNSFYRIPYIYESGYILYRLRVLGRIPANNWAYNVPARWSYESGVLNVSGFPDIFPAAAGFCPGANENFISFSTMNWQSAVSFAEEGKRSAVVNFADGTLRNRQTVTKMTSKNEIIIGETIYDFQGRPAVNILPVPSSAQKITYVTTFNQVSSGVPYVKDHFDYDAGTCAASASPLDVISGASNYYSSSNPVMTDENKYIPDAMGYPFTHTEYTPDNTGRIRNQSGVGPDHQIGTDREVKHLYGVPEQKDLDRLFASEVGNAVRYKKNLSIDPNGQASVTYLDPAGRTIATALAGTPPPNVIALPSAGQQLTTYDLLNKVNPADNSGPANNIDIPNKKVGLQKTILVPSNGPYSFTYAVTPPNFNENCASTLTIPPGASIALSGSKCYNCVLDVNVSLKDECNKELFSQAFNASPAANSTVAGVSSTVCPPVAQSAFIRTFDPYDVNNAINTAWLKTGSYVLEKTYAINQAALDVYTKNYMDTTLNPCILKLSDFKVAQNPLINISGCGLTCASCNTALGTYSQYAAPNCTLCLTLDEFNALKAECDELCSATSDKCANALQMMEADVSPTGQYGQYNSSSSTPPGNIVIPTPTVVASVASFPVSVFNETNSLPIHVAMASLFTSNPDGSFFSGSPAYKPDWRHPYNPAVVTATRTFQYLDVNGEVAYVIVVSDGASNYIPAVHALHLGKVITDPITGDLKVPVKYLANLSDLLNIWQEQWAKSLVIYHPEYPYYEKCVFDQLSNDFDENLTELETMADFNLFLTAIGSATTSNQFMYPVGVPTGTVFNSAIVDPYFLSAASGSLDLGNIQTAMLKYMIDPNNPGTYISIWDAAYRAVNCPNGGGGSFCTSSVMPNGYVFTTDKEWEVFKGMYLSLKQATQNKINNNYAITKFAYNACIGAEVFNPFPYNFFNPAAISFVVSYNPNFAFFWSGWPFFWPTIVAINISQYYNPEQPCNLATYQYYADKNARFATPSMMMPGALSNIDPPCYDEDGNIIPCAMTVSNVVQAQANAADLNAYINCGQCPAAVNFEQLLKGLATYSTTSGTQDLVNTSNVPLTCAPGSSPHEEFTNELSVNMFTTVPTAVVNWQNTTTSGTYLQGKFINTGSSTTCTLHLEMQAMIVPEGVPNSTVSYVPFANPYLYTDIVDFCCIKYNPTSYTFPGPYVASGEGRFSGQVTVLTKSPDPLYDPLVPTYRKIQIQGYNNCMNFRDCSFDPICQASKEIKHLQNLLNALMYNAPNTATLSPIFNNTVGGVLLTGLPYVGFLQPSLIVSLDNAVQPATNNLADPWIWKNTAGSSGKTLSGYLSPSSSSTAQCNLSIVIPATSSYNAADLKQITGILPSTVAAAPAGAFTAYALLSVSGSSVSVWEPVTGTISCLSAGKCSTNGGGDFQAEHGECQVAELVVNGDFEQGNINFYSDYGYDPNSSLLLQPYAPAALPYAASTYSKTYNVYNIKPVMNTCTLSLSDHTSYFNYPILSPLLSCSLTGNGKALAMRTENPNLNYSVAPPADVWYQFFNLKANSTYSFNAYFRSAYTYGLGGAWPYTGIVLQLYVNNTLVGSKVANQGDAILPPNWHDAPFQFTTGSNALGTKVSIKMFYARYLGNSTTFLSPLPGAYNSDLLMLLDDVSLKGCKVGDPLACDIPIAPPFAWEDDCQENAQSTALEEAEYNYNFYLDTLRKNFQNRYVKKCLNAYEDFFMKCNDSEHHFTLYYYDEAGNLVRTVPPEGVNRLADNVGTLSQIMQDRQNNTKVVYTNHTYASTYKYNSLDQLVSEEIPDHSNINSWQTSNFAGVPNTQNIVGLAYNGSNGVLLSNNGVTGSLYTQIPGTNSWQQITNLSVSDLNDVVYTAVNTAYAVGKNGTILKTVNNGVAWNVMSFPSAATELYRVHKQPSPSTEVVVYDKDGNSWASSSGGTIWTQNANALGFAPGEKLVDLDASTVSTDICAVSSLNKIYTYNGVNWSVVTNAVKTMSLRKVTGSGTALFAVGDDGTILKSTNSGLNWTEKVSPYTGMSFVDAEFYDANTGFAITSAGDIHQIFTSGANYADLGVMINAPTGAIDLSVLSGVGFVFAVDAVGNVKYYDYGTAANIWTSIGTTIGSSYCIKAMNQNRIFVGGAGGAVYSLDVASPFFSPDISAISLLPIPISETIKAIDFRPTTGPNFEGYVLTVAGNVYYYNSISDDFQPVSGLTTGIYKDVVATGGGNGYVVSDNGKITPMSGAVGTEPVGTSTSSFRSVFVTTGGTLVAVGENTSDTKGAITIGGTVSGLFTNISGNVNPPALSAVSMAGSTPYICGSDGTVLKYNTGTSFWETLETADNTNLKTISASGSNVVSGGLQDFVTPSANNIIYSGNAGVTWAFVANGIGNVNNSAIVGSGNVFMNGPGLLIANDASWPPTGLSALPPTGAAFNTFNSLASDGTSIKVVGTGGALYGSPVSSPVFAAENGLTTILNDVKWYDATHVIAVGNAGQIVVSDNAGLNWRLINTGLSGNLKTVEMLNATTAVVAGTGNEYVHITLSCVGPACTYNTVVVNKPSANAATAYSDISIVAGNIIVVGNITALGSIWYKPSATLTWPAAIASGITQPLNSVYMVNNTFAYAVGNSATLRRINPSTSAVTTIVAPVLGSNHLMSVYFVDNLLGYVVGAGGLLSKTTDGGSTWINQTTPSSITAGITSNVIVPNSSGGVAIGANSGRGGAVVDNNNGKITSRFYYDRMGRLVASQNSKQYGKHPLTYSYTKYDDLNRIIEVGEVKALSDIENLPNLNNSQVNYGSFLGWVTSGTLTEITKTYYDLSIVSPSPSYDGAGTFVQDAFSMINRVAYTTYQDVAGPTFTTATYYSYDIHGNVKTLYQYNALHPNGNKYKRTDYDYDLISGKVNSVTYQAGARDQFYHKYYYDADNRLTNVYSSKENAIWDQDAKYFYYRHGPMARVEEGENKVQAFDHAYTIQGWMKGVNSEKLVALNDMGNDALPVAGSSINKHVSLDAMGYVLGFFDTDYTAIGEGLIAPSDYFLADRSASSINIHNVNLYNGNVSNMSRSIKQLMVATSGQPINSMYRYDQLNRIIHARTLESFNLVANRWNNVGSLNSNFREYFAYDASGNLQRLKRHNNTGGVMDSLVYQYNTIANGATKNSNKLGAVRDFTATGAIADDIESGQVFNVSNHSLDNYNYDNIGNLVKDQQEEIASIDWTVYGKIKEIKRISGSFKPDLVYTYDPAGNRVSKTAKTKGAGGSLNPSNQWNYTYYGRDAHGNIMAVYDLNPGNGNRFYLTEQHLYGSSRIGVLNRSEDMTGGFSYNGFSTREAGKKSFELANHLGNVLTVITDRKLPVDDGVYNASGTKTSSTPDGTVDYYTPDIASAVDYYAFGSPMPGKQFNNGTYRYGYNGKENDNEVKGTGNSQDYGMRIYDPRIGRFLSADPMFRSFAWNSTYAFAENDVIRSVDIDGLEKEFQIQYKDKSGAMLWHTVPYSKIHPGQEHGPLGKGEYVYYIDQKTNQYKGEYHKTRSEASPIRTWAEDFDNRYKGNKGLKNAVEDAPVATKVVAGVIIVGSAITGQPEGVAAGVTLYNYADKVGNIIQATEGVVDIVEGANNGDQGQINKGIVNVVGAGADEFTGLIVPKISQGDKMLEAYGTVGTDVINTVITNNAAETVKPDNQP